MNASSVQRSVVFTQAVHTRSATGSEQVNRPRRAAGYRHVTASTACTRIGVACGAEGELQVAEAPPLEALEHLTALAQNVPVGAPGRSSRSAGSARPTSCSPYATSTMSPARPSTSRRGKAFTCLPKSSSTNGSRMPSETSSPMACGEVPASAGAAPTGPDRDRRAARPPRASRGGGPGAARGTSSPPRRSWTAYRPARGSRRSASTVAGRTGRSSMKGTCRGSGIDHSALKAITGWAGCQAASSKAGCIQSGGSRRASSTSVTPTPMPTTFASRRHPSAARAFHEASVAATTRDPDRSSTSSWAMRPARPSRCVPELQP